MSSDFCLLYVTAKDRDQAMLIGRTLVHERLAACANVLDGMTSIYWWDGAVQDGQESILLLKTRQSLSPQAIQRIRDLHSYDCPCVVSLPITGGNPDFLDWISAETAT